MSSNSPIHLKCTLYTFLAALLVVFLQGCRSEPEMLVASPDGDIRLQFRLDSVGTPSYEVSFKGLPVILPSTMGFEFKDQAPLGGNMEILQISRDSLDESWNMPWGEQAVVQNHYNELRVALKEKGNPHRRVDVVFRIFDDGLGFRYEFPEQEGMDEVVISDENTEFRLTGDHKVWWLPGDWDSYEHLYKATPFSEIDALQERDDPNLTATYIPENAVNTPVTMKTGDGLYLSFHESDLTNYAGMTLKVNPGDFSMKSELVGSERLGGKARVSAPFETPWRTLQIAERPGDLIESRMILNLNDPNAIGDVGYFTPMKYVGIWWEMHLGKSTWDMEGSQNMSSYTEGTRALPHHGATTENAKRYIDFAAANGFKGLLVEGWNTGWDKWINNEDREGVFDFITPYADYDFDEVRDYAEVHGVQIIMHHETSAAPRTYEKQMPAAYKFMQDNHIHSVKTGYVGKVIPKGEYHHGQWMVNHYQKVLEEAARMKIAVDAHEPIKATGKRRTFPNAISREGLRGQEFNAWSVDGGNPPDHLPTVAFTRMLAGPIDFTPGIFNLKFDEYKKDNQVNTTLAKQLALYVVIYSPIQMVADLPEHYMLHGAFHPALQFIRDVGVDWSESRVLAGEIGEYVTIARKEKGSERWFVGGITNEDARDQKLHLDFLTAGKTYTATLYTDAEDADWDTNPQAYSIETREVNSTDILNLQMAPGGGFAVSIIPKAPSL